MYPFSLTECRFGRVKIPGTFQCFTGWWNDPPGTALVWQPSPSSHVWAVLHALAEDRRASGRAPSSSILGRGASDSLTALAPPVAQSRLSKGCCNSTAHQLCDLHKGLKIPASQFPHLWNGNGNNNCLPELLKVFNELIYVKYLAVYSI